MENTSQKNKPQITTINVIFCCFVVLMFACVSYTIIMIDQYTTDFSELNQLNVHDFLIFKVGTCSLGINNKII